MPHIESMNNPSLPEKAAIPAPVDSKIGTVEINLRSSGTTNRSTFQFGPIPLEQFQDNLILSRFLALATAFLSTASLSLLKTEAKRILPPGEVTNGQKIRELAAKLDSGKLVASAEFHDRPDGQTILVLTLDPKKGA